MAEIIPLGDAARKPSDTLADDALAKLQAAFADELAAVEQHIATHMDSVTEIIPQITSPYCRRGRQKIAPPAHPKRGAAAGLSRGASHYIGGGG